MLRANTRSLRWLSSNKISPTLHIPAYLRDTYQYQLTTSVVQISPDGLYHFADTILHPQGGGQPMDQGFIIHRATRQAITGATHERETGKIWHRIEGATLKIGDSVQMQIDPTSRLRNAKLHSAGHLIDLAVHRLGLNWESSKGYHFEESPYVEYRAAKPDNIEECVIKINDEISHLLKEDIQVVKQFYSLEEASKLGLLPPQFVAPYVSIIRYWDSWCLCGGTHIGKVSELSSLKVSKLERKGKFLKAKYRVQ